MSGRYVEAGDGYDWVEDPVIPSVPATTSGHYVEAGDGYSWVLDPVVAPVQQASSTPVSIPGLNISAPSSITTNLASNPEYLNALASSGETGQSISNIIGTLTPVMQDIGNGMTASYSPVTGKLENIYSSENTGGRYDTQGNFIPFQTTGFNLGSFISGGLSGLEDLATSDAVKTIAPMALSAGLGGASEVGNLFGLNGTTGALVGGAALGGGTAALTGGDIGQGLLTGAIGGAGADLSGTIAQSLGLSGTAGSIIGNAGVGALTSLAQGNDPTVGLVTGGLKGLFQDFTQPSAITVPTESPALPSSFDQYLAPSDVITVPLETQPLNPSFEQYLAPVSNVTVPTQEDILANNNQFIESISKYQEPFVDTTTDVPFIPEPVTIPVTQAPVETPIEVPSTTTVTEPVVPAEVPTEVPTEVTPPVTSEVPVEVAPPAVSEVPAEVPTEVPTETISPVATEVPMEAVTPPEDIPEMVVTAPAVQTVPTLEEQQPTLDQFIQDISQYEVPAVTSPLDLLSSVDQPEDIPEMVVTAPAVQTVPTQEQQQPTLDQFIESISQYEVPPVSTVDYSLGGIGSTRLDEMNGAQGLQVPAVNEPVTVVDTPIDYSLSTSVPFEGLQLPVISNLDTMGGGQGLSVTVPGGTVTEDGFVPTGTLPALGDTTSFINNPKAIEEAITAAPPPQVMTKEQFTAILRGLTGLFGTGLLSNTNQQTVQPRQNNFVAPTQGIPTYSPAYFQQVQQGYNKLLPNQPRDVATPLQNWYNSSYSGKPDSVTAKLFGVI